MIIDSLCDRARGRSGRFRGSGGLVRRGRRGYTEGMTSKDLAIRTIQELPDTATWEDIEERVRFLAGIDKGLADIKAGRVVAHEEVRESLRKWLAE